MPPREAPPVGSDVPPPDSSLSFTEDLTAEASPVIASAVEKFQVISLKVRHFLEETKLSTKFSDVSWDLLFHPQCFAKGIRVNW